MGKRLSEQESTFAENAAILCSTVLWGTLWIPLRQLRETGASGASATAVSLMVPLILLLPFALGKWRRILATSWDLGLLAPCLALCFGLYAEGLVRGQVARVILLFYLTPVWSTLLGRFLLGEPITRRRVTTIILGLAGMSVILDVGAKIPVPSTVADWMGLAAGMLWGLSMVYVNRTASHPIFDRLLVQFVFLGPIFFLVTLIPGGTGHAGFEARALLDSASWLVALAVIWMLPVVWLTIFGASRLDPGRVGILLMFEIIVGLTTAALLANEPFGLREITGALLIMGASGIEVTTRPPPPTPRGSDTNSRLS
jgi:drug/metabolite transporter (DMT)-like permease